MTSASLTQNAYGNATRATGTERGVEYQVFGQVTGRLRRAAVAGRPFAELAQALHDNLRLWTVIALDVTGSGNRLPAPLRGQLASLSRFVRSHTAQVLRRQAGVDVLIDINTAVMRGLRGQPPAAGG